MQVNFKAGGMLNNISTDGRTTIRLDVPNNGADAANKQLTADTVNAVFDDAGKYLRRAEANGNAELLVQPLVASALNYRTTIYAPRFECEFFATGSNARTCAGGKRTKTVREPTVASEGHGTQTLVAEELLASFSESTKDIESLKAEGSAKFTELDRSATSSEMTFTQADRTVRLRGGEPTTWDGRSRAKAREVDWNTGERRSYLRGGVSTTYYSKRSAGDAVPFGDSDKPVFATSENAEFDHNTEVAMYTGNARGWQDDNYVRANRFLIYQREGRFTADGAVQSLLYDARQERKSSKDVVPVYGSAASLTYVRDNRLLQYRQDVDIRQGTDRLTAQSADVYLDEQNELVSSIAETGVVLTQPGRRASGDWVRYTAADELAIIKGNPARVEDSASGTSQGGQLSVYLKDNRVVAEGRTKQNAAGRTRSVYKVKNN
jgi:lipopolysaccharide export system protein LptA